MTDERPTYAYYPIFHSSWSHFEDRPDDDELVAGLEKVLAEWSDRIELRGAYSLAGFGSSREMMMWCVARSVEDIQGLVLDIRRTDIGKHLMELANPFLGVVRPPETAPDHIPAFLRGEQARRYICVYPFVRTPEWYLLPREERAALLREHGEIGREYPGVMPNTTSAFGLGDYEWILAFESDDLVELVDCIRRLRDSRSRLYVKEETPFVTGIRKELAEVIRDVL